MENFKLKNRFIYGSHIILLWFLCGLLFYCFLNLVTQAPQEDSNFLSHYSSESLQPGYMVASITL